MIEMSCTCQSCGNSYKVDVVVPDDLWELIKPKDKPTGGGLLCGVCIIRRLEKLGNYVAFDLVVVKG